MGQYLMDTNAVIEFFNGNLPQSGRLFIAAIAVPEISVITHIKLLSNKNVPAKEWAQLQAFVSFAMIHSINDAIVQQTIALRQLYKLKTPDAIIAATALVHNLELVSRNTSDFKNIQGLTVINPHTI